MSRPLHAVRRQDARLPTRRPAAAADAHPHELADRRLPADELRQLRAAAALPAPERPVLLYDAAAVHVRVQRFAERRRRCRRGGAELRGRRQAVELAGADRTGAADAAAGAAVSGRAEDGAGLVLAAGGALEVRVSAAVPAVRGGDVVGRMRGVASLSFVVNVWRKLHCRSFADERKRFLSFN